MVVVAKQTELTFDMVRELARPRSPAQRPSQQHAPSAPRPTPLPPPQITVMGCVAMLIVGLLMYFSLRKSPVYLVDFSVYRAPDT